MGEQGRIRQVQHVGAGELNRVRHAFSDVKCGRFALAAWPASVHTLVISDVPGDDPSLIASGPTVPPAQDGKSALGIVDRLGVAVPAHVREARARVERIPMERFPIARLS